MTVLRGSAIALLVSVSSFALTLGVRPASAQQTAQQTLVLDPITVLATKTPESVWDSLSAASAITQETINQTMPRRPSELFGGVPGVSFQERGDDPATSINIRGLQDFGRVAVIVDGARQNFQKSGHNANGAFYLEPELLSGVDIVRGPVANVYGSGAIGGVVSFKTKDVDDVLKPGERIGAMTHTMLGSNQNQGLASIFSAARPTSNVDVFAGVTYSSFGAYEAGTRGGPQLAGQVAPGVEVPNSDSQAKSGIAKFTVRPADGHSVKFSMLTYDNDYITGQPGSSTYSTHAKNHIVSTGYRYSRPDDRLFDVDANVYWTETRQNQVKVSGATSTSTGRIGDPRYFLIDTIGTDVHNTSRLDTGPIQHAFTYGFDAFRDSVNSYDPGGANDNFTPAGKRTVSGGFLQWKADYARIVEFITAARYDDYRLDGNGVSNSGTRLSPKFTLGVTPIPGITVYGTYAEGYRAPALTETINAGFHPPFATCAFCPTTPGFQFVPNPSLSPEVGKNKEIGVNLRFDNVFFAADKVRGKINVYRNDVTDYIDAVAYGPINAWGQPSFYQYRNVGEARINGFEYELSYDAGSWFAGVAGHQIRGKNLTTDGPLGTIPADKVATTLGVRLFDRKVSAAVQWQSYTDIGAVPAGYTPRPSYDLVNLYFGYDPKPNVSFGASVENLLDKYYIRYTDGVVNPGITYKASLRVRFSDARPLL